MVRNYVKKIGPRGHCRYSQETKNKAIEEVRNRQISIRGAAQKYGVPYATLNDAIKGKHPLKIGRPTALSNIEESKLVEILMTCANWGFPLTNVDTKKIVKCYLDNLGKVEKRFQHNKPGHDWFTNFIKRHRELTIRLGENIKRVRASVSEEIINNYFENLQTCLEGVPPSNIINYDETNFTDDPGTIKVVVKRGSKHPERVIDNSKTSISVMIAASADGYIFPPYTVYKAKHIYPTWIEGGIPGSGYNRNSSGWFDLIIFEEWWNTIILPRLKKLDGPKVVIGDNLSSHVSYHVIRSCADNNIRFVLLPPNSTHICQPLDVAFFRPLKMEWRKVLTTWKEKNRGVLPKSEFPKLLRITLETVGYKESKNAIAGFKASGIYPLDKEQVLKKIPKQKNEEEEVAEINRSWTEAIVNHLKEARGFTNTPQSRPRRGKRLAVPAGKSIVPDDVINKEIDEDNITLNNAEVMESEEEADVDNEAPVEYEEEIEEETCSSFLGDHTKSASTSKQSEIEEQNNKQEDSELNKSDFVIVQFPTEKRNRFYIGQITDKVSDDEFVINFLRKRVGLKESYFYFPNVKDEDFILKKDIVKKLKSPKVTRGKYVFVLEMLEMVENIE